MVAWVVILAHTAFLVAWPLADTTIRNHRLRQDRIAGPQNADQTFFRLRTNSTRVALGAPRGRTE